MVNLPLGKSQDCHSQINQLNQPRRDLERMHILVKSGLACPYLTTAMLTLRLHTEMEHSGGTLPYLLGKTILYLLAVA